MDQGARHKRDVATNSSCDDVTRLRNRHKVLTDLHDADAQNEPLATGSQRLTFAKIEPWSPWSCDQCHQHCCQFLELWPDERWHSAICRPQFPKVPNGHDRQNCWKKSCTHSANWCHSQRRHEFEKLELNVPEWTQHSPRGPNESLCTDCVELFDHQRKCQSWWTSGKRLTPVHWSPSFIPAGLVYVVTRARTSAKNTFTLLFWKQSTPAHNITLNLSLFWKRITSIHLSIYDETSHYFVYKVITFKANFTKQPSFTSASMWKEKAKEV